MKSHYVHGSLALTVVFVAAIIAFSNGCSGETLTSTSGATVAAETTVTTMVESSTTSKITSTTDRPEPTVTTKKPTTTTQPESTTVTTKKVTTTEKSPYITAEELEELRVGTGIGITSCIGEYQGIYDHRLGPGYGEFMVFYRGVLYRAIVTSDPEQLVDEPQVSREIEGTKVLIRIEPNKLGHEREAMKIAASIR